MSGHSRLIVGGAIWSRTAKNGEAGFETPCASEEMASHGLGGADGQFAGVISEGAADGGCFGTVAEQR